MSDTGGEVVSDPGELVVRSVSFIHRKAVFVCQIFLTCAFFSWLNIKVQVMEKHVLM